MSPGAGPFLAWGSLFDLFVLIYVTFCQLWANCTSQREGSGYRGTRAMPYSFQRSTLVLLHAQCIALIHGTSV